VLAGIFERTIFNPKENMDGKFVAGVFVPDDLLSPEKAQAAAEDTGRRVAPDEWRCAAYGAMLVMYSRVWGVLRTALERLADIEVEQGVEDARRGINSECS
jgi:hypothetical protein